MTIFTITTATPKTTDVFGVPVGLLLTEQPIEKDKYTPESCIDTKKLAQGTVGTAAGVGVIGAMANGAVAGGRDAAAATVISLAVGGAIAGVTGLYNALTHQRVTYVTIRNTSKRTFKYLSGYNNSGHATVPDIIPINSVVRMAFHNKGSFSGAVRFASNEDFLYIGSSNPSIGKNKLRVECRKSECDLYKYWDEMGIWDTREDCGRDVFLSGCVYDNPSQCFVDIKHGMF